MSTLQSEEVSLASLIRYAFRTEQVQIKTQENTVQNNLFCEENIKCQERNSPPIIMFFYSRNYILEM